ncbi:MAG TPA: hypothetical protein ENI87_13195 [bacterium]|nr:hypothetical protein [bacterium]
MAALLGLATLSACGRDTPTGATGPAAGARTVDVEAIADSDLRDAILDECHRPLRRRMQRVKVTVTLPDGHRLLVQADLPDKVRVRADRRELLLRDGAVHAFDGELSAADDSLVRSLAVLVDAVALGPLYRAKRLRREGTVCTLDDTAILTLHAGTLLPASLTVAGREVRFDGYLHTPSSWVVNRATLAPLGSCEVRFEDGGVVFPSGYFDVPDPDRRSRSDTHRMPVPGAVVETQSPTPIVVAGKALRLVLLPDPGDWRRRHARYRPVYEELEAQDQFHAGFPALLEEDGERLLGVPFRHRGAGHPRFRAPAGWRIRDVPKGRLLVVYPPTGTVEERIAAGREMLERALKNRRWTARGPIMAQPFVQLHEGVPDAAKLAATKVRVSVRIE